MINAPYGIGDYRDRGYVLFVMSASRPHRKRINRATLSRGSIILRQER